MPLFQTLIHPTDFDEPSKEAFRVARALAEALGARVIAFHVVPHPAVVTQDGRVIRDPHKAEPIDLWEEYRTLQADTPKVPVQYAVVVGDKAEARRLLEEKVRELGEGVLVVMGSHDVALDIVLGALAERGFSARAIAVGSLGGVAAVERGECDLAPVHLLDPNNDRYNVHLVRPGLRLVKGWARMQGFVHRAGDARFAGSSAAQALRGALADRACLIDALGMIATPVRQTGLRCASARSAPGSSRTSRGRAGRCRRTGR